MFNCSHKEIFDKYNIYDYSLPSAQLHKGFKHVGEKPFACTKCDKKFTTRKRLDFHHRTHSETPKRFFCDECPASYQTNRNLITHKRLHTGEKPFVCSECGASYRKQYDLREHTLIVHRQEKNHVCDVCQLAFSTRRVMNNHRRKHSTNRHQCSLCPKTFAQKADLTSHLLIHAGERPYACTECDEKFNRKRSLRDHKLSSHSQEKNFVCDVCQMSFSTRSLLYSHRRKHNTGRYPCSECPKSFARAFDLRIHAVLHTGEKPYICDICNKNFATRQNYNHHWKTHMGDTLQYLKCECCYKRFLNNIDQENHMKSHVAAEKTA